MQRTFSLLNRAPFLWISILLLVGALVAFSGCRGRFPLTANSTSIFPLPTHFTYAVYVNASNATDESLWSWYKVFKSPYLKRVVKEALHKNLDVALAAQRLIALRYAYLKSRSSLYPRADISLGVRRQRSSYEIPLPFGKSKTVSRTSNTYSLEGVVSYELDIWGKLRYSREVERENLLKGRQERDVVRLGVVSQCVEYFFDVAALDKEIALVKREISLLRKLYLLTSSSFERGMAPLSRVKDLERRLASAQGDLTELVRQRLHLCEEMDVLLGGYPAGKCSWMPSEGVRLNIPFIPVCLPSTVIARRPDVRAALCDLRASLASYGYARAIRFPSITLSASGGFTSGELATLFDPISRIWALSGEVLYPLFNANKLKYNQKQARAVLEEAIIRYQKTVLNAMLEVESGLSNSASFRKELELAQVALLHLKEKMVLDRERFDRGLVDASVVLEDELEYVRERIRVLHLRLKLIQNDIFLFKAMGGGLF